MPERAWDGTAAFQYTPLEWAVILWVICLIVLALVELSREER